MKDITLVVMAAGIGSRFGKGVKQLTPVGPSGELIMDYSVHDAIEAGFNKIVFILRKAILEEFRQTISKKMEGYASVDYVFQELDDLPEGFTCPADRIKPWGTGQAVLCCRGTVKGPFAVINADDYYGKEPYKILYDYLTSERPAEPGVSDICCAGFRLGNTLSENGGVTRGICDVNGEGFLTGVHETKNIYKTADGAAVINGEERIPVDPDKIASMNMWGFGEDFIDLLEGGFKEFLKEQPEGDISGEFLLPIYIDQLIRSGRAKVRVLPTEASWFGVTYQEDKPAVIEAFAELVKEGVYKADLYDAIAAAKQ
ncbi:MAG: nucleotidyltransferase [Lachnospiraceae bacterium]|nr:nucleotidyltransferase [Lachnospiraceae bacterium]